MLLFAHMGRGEVNMVSKASSAGDNNMAVIGRSTRPVGVTYDPITQVNIHSEVFSIPFLI